MKINTLLLISLMILVFTNGAKADYTEADVDNSFYPYKNSTPEFTGYEPGLTINQKNVDQFKDILDPAMYKLIKDGATKMDTMATDSFDLHPNYVKATKNAINNPPTLKEDGTIANYIAGRPFPSEPDASDSSAGTKLIWNYQYGYNWGDNAAIYPFYWGYRNYKTGKLERTLKFNFHFLNWAHRVNQDPVPEITPNPSKLFRSIYVQVLEPFDLANTQLLIHRYQNDLKRDDAWLYLGFQRRVRRLATGQVTDSFLGSELMIEDFEGYNGRVSDYNWKYLETKNIMLPFYRHNELPNLATNIKDKDGYQFVDFGGQGGCFPKIKWQLRKSYIIEGTAKDSGHPLSKRLMYLDAQTFTIPRQVMYDRKGDIWKTFIIGQANPLYHLPKNKNSGVSIDDSFMALDVQAGHCTTGQFKGQVDPKLNPTSKFTVQNLRKSGK